MPIFKKIIYNFAFAALEMLTLMSIILWLFALAMWASCCRELRVPFHVSQHWARSSIAVMTNRTLVPSWWRHGVYTLISDLLTGSKLTAWNSKEATVDTAEWLRELYEHFLTCSSSDLQQRWGEEESAEGMIAKGSWGPTNLEGWLNTGVGFCVCWWEI